MFDESKHPRDGYGRFTYVNGAGKTYRQNTNYADIIAADAISRQKTRQTESYASGAQSGALDSDNKDWVRASKHAAMMYETFRNIKSDVPQIAQVTGLTEEQIQRIKNHLFFNEYELSDGKHRFYPDFNQAQSWDRLRKGIPLEHDLIMLEHELAEESLMANGMGYDEAHINANRTANYQEALKEYKNALVKKKRN